MQPSSVTRLLLPVLCGLLVLAGCAGKLPKTLPLSSAGEQEAAALWSAFAVSKRPPALDADVRLGWDVLGSKGAVSATLQVQRPAHLHFAANDPLGRALILAVADATSFTMVDNRIGHVYQGTIHSKFWQSYVPAAVAPEDLLPLLGGFLSEEVGQQIEPSQDATGQGFWYQWRDVQAVRHHVLLDRQSGAMRQHLLFDAQGDLLLELHYADYRKDGKSGFVWPGQVRVSGEAVTGTLTLQVEQIYSHAPQRAATFRLTPPPHFTVEQVH
jgi:hypothetical protein